MSTRLSININDETRDALRELKRRTGRTYTQIVYRAVVMYAMLWREQVAGREIRLVQRGHDDTKVRIL